MDSCCNQTLKPDLIRLEFNKYACCVVCAAPGYPGMYPKNLQIQLPTKCMNSESKIFHAGTKIGPIGECLSDGGRVLSVTGVGENLIDAVSNSYRCIGNTRKKSQVSFEGMHYRKDIAAAGIKEPIRLGILGSTNGTNMLAIINAIKDGSLNAVISVVISNRERAGILEKARLFGLPNYYVNGKGKAREVFDFSVSELLENVGVELVLMIGYMRIVSFNFTERWSGHCINVHPSLLPEFAGGMDKDVHAAVIAAGKKKTGCSVHMVTEKVDGGAILMQKSCSVEANDTPETLKVKVQTLEGVALIECIKMFKDNKVAAILNKRLGTLSKMNNEVAQMRSETEIFIAAMKDKFFMQGSNPNISREGFFSLTKAGRDTDTFLALGSGSIVNKFMIGSGEYYFEYVAERVVASSLAKVLKQGAMPLLFCYNLSSFNRIHDVQQMLTCLWKSCEKAKVAMLDGIISYTTEPEAKECVSGLCIGAIHESKTFQKIEVTAGNILIGIPSIGLYGEGLMIALDHIKSCGYNLKDEVPFLPGRLFAEMLLSSNKINPGLFKIASLNLVYKMIDIDEKGFMESITDIIPDDCCATIDIEASGWTLSPFMKWLQTQLNYAQDDLLRKFNCDIGMVLIVPQDSAVSVVNYLSEKAYFLGTIQARQSKAKVITIGQFNDIDA